MKVIQQMRNHGYKITLSTDGERVDINHDQPQKVKDNQRQAWITELKQNKQEALLDLLCILQDAGIEFHLDEYWQLKLSLPEYGNKKSLLPMIKQLKEKEQAVTCWLRDNYRSCNVEEAETLLIDANEGLAASYPEGAVNWCNIIQPELAARLHRIEVRLDRECRQQDHLTFMLTLHRYNQAARRIFEAYSKALLEDHWLTVGDYIELEEGA